MVSFRHAPTTFGLAVLTFRLSITRFSCFQKKLTAPSCETTNAAVLVRDGDAAQRGAVAHAEALAVDRRARSLGTRRLPNTSNADTRDRRVDDDLGAEAEDAQIGAQHERAVDGGQSRDEVGGVRQILFGDERRVLRGARDRRLVTGVARLARAASAASTSSCRALRNGRSDRRARSSRSSTSNFIRTGNDASAIPAPRAAACRRARAPARR